jgi:hypothetical protein
MRKGFTFFEAFIVAAIFGILTSFVIIGILEYKGTQKASDGTFYKITVIDDHEYITTIRFGKQNIIGPHKADCKKCSEIKNLPLELPKQ